MLYCKFDEISIIKQLSGSHGSSEVYIVCRKLKEPLSQEMKEYLLEFLKNFDPNHALFPKEIIPDSFIKQLDSLIEIFVKKQERYLKRSFYYNDNPKILEKHMNRIKKYKYERAKAWIKQIKFKTILDKDLL